MPVLLLLLLLLFPLKLVNFKPISLLPGTNDGERGSRSKGARERKTWHGLVDKKGII